MKIGILTFHFGYNYGGVLQSYALQQYLLYCGHEVNVINYTPSNFNYRPYWRQFISRNVSVDRFCKITRKIQHGPKQKKAFHLFRSSYLRLTENYSETKLSEISHEFDTIIVGSDQIWNPGNHQTGTYFLADMPSFKGKRISYAPCCTINIVETKNKNKLINALNIFNSLSVRDQETKKFVFNLINRTPQLVVDPTLLWDFNELISNEPLIPGDYVLTYILGKEITGGHRNIINRIKSKYPNTSVVSIIQTENNPQIFNWSDKTYWTAGPTEWVNLFYHSTFVYTDSFHGVLFSIKFKKPFIAYYAEKNRASRFADLSKRFRDIDHCIVNSYNDALIKESFTKEIDYSSLYKTLTFEVEQSVSFLEAALQND